ncbi:hypothetical protein CMT57_06440 [Elizabethkingia anophelis]|uniref:hypothetical protein n=1 Tax=Elizabethkingia anophelis TaxID=1117645 RepID=UPI002012819C|nr:hypothetical protein [Elizabethkingia anophelis]MCL1689399.1 hypothetical protein [Elizabethkingia anophelis]MDV4009472.1 hypothetical protein [Elizabethkingia anophelis]
MKRNSLSYRYEYLLGQSKSEVLLELDHFFSFLYSDDVWIYDIEKYWCGLKEKIMFIEFENDIVNNVHVKYFYFKMYR